MKNDKMKDKQLIHKLFIDVLKLMLIVCIFNIIGNLIYGFPIMVNIKWVIFLGVTILTYHFTKKYVGVIWKFFYFSIIIFGMLPFSFIDSGGSNNNTIGYLFIVIICITFFFWGWQRYFLVISTILIFNFMIILEKQLPDIIKVYSDESQLLDRMVQISLLLFLTFFFLKNFSDAYSKDKKILDKIVHFDSLTGLYNRRAFDELFRESFTCNINKYNFLLFIDIDRFKVINDTMGHQHGDLMIKSTAKLLQKIFSDYGIVARWGGDEFSILFKGKEDKLVKLLSEFNETNIVSVSCGYTKILYGLNEEIILRQADYALYQSKNKGRNQWNKYDKNMLE